jgi:hypothetical protein
MTAIQLAQALLAQYPPNAEVLIDAPVRDEYGLNGTSIRPVTEILLDEGRNTIELVAN